MRLILASASPRRHDLLTQITADFEVIPADIDEVFDSNLPEVSVQVADLARQKAVAVANSLQNTDTTLILGADTIVYLHPHILVKPQDADEADVMLSQLSGRSHQVMTGLALVTKKGDQVSVQTNCVTSQVKMRIISQQERQDYIATGEPIDKAGAYAIQGGAADFITAIEGSYENIVGLPLQATRELLQSAHYPNLT